MAHDNKPVDSVAYSTDSSSSTVFETGSHALVTISGPPGCGATTVATQLAEELDYNYVNGGQMFRNLAEERDVSLNELLEQAERDDTIDRSLDTRIQRIIDQHNFTDSGLIIESRLAGWVAGDDADIKLWLDAPADVRIERTKYRSQEDIALREREQNDADRYESYYGIDLADTRFYDLHINTARWSPKATISLVLQGLRGYSVESDEGAFENDFDPGSNP